MLQQIFQCCQETIYHFQILTRYVLTTSLTIHQQQDSIETPWQK